MSPTIVAIVAAILAPLVSFLVAARKLSGKIGTSEASDLWEESRSLRSDLTTRNEYLRTIIDQCEKRIANAEKRIEELEIRNQALYLENGNLRRMIEEHESTIRELRTQVHRLSDENAGLRSENKKLRVRVSELEHHTESEKTK